MAVGLLRPIASIEALDMAHPIEEEERLEATLNVVLWKKLEVKFFQHQTVLPQPPRPQLMLFFQSNSEGQGEGKHTWVGALPRG
jgi:hypothetical protein